MKFLQEALTSIHRLEPEANTDQVDLDAAPADDDQTIGDQDGIDTSTEDPSDGLDLDATDDHAELDGIADDATDDPDHQGLIRTVKGAHLVYKRESEEGSFEELWIYNVTTLRDELIVKKAILASTDIPPNKMTSPDGLQTYEIWSAGNAELMLIQGMPN